MSAKTISTSQPQWLHFSFLTLIVMTLCASLVTGCRHDSKRTQSRAQMLFSEAASEKSLHNDSAELKLLKEFIEECALTRYEHDDSTLQLLPTALVQTLNCYQRMAQPEQCEAYFKQLLSSASKSRQNTLARHFRRDISVVLAYAMSRTEHTSQAATLMDKALTLPAFMPTAEKEFRDYAYAAAVYYCVDSCQEKMLNSGKRALAAIDRCERMPGASWLYAMMGMAYQRMGDVANAIKMYEREFAMARHDNDSLGMINSAKDIADYLLRLDMTDEATRYAVLSVNLLEGQHGANPMVAAQTFIVRAKTLAGSDSLKEALAYINRAHALCKDLPYNSGMSDIDLLKGKMLMATKKKNTKTATDEGRKMLERAARQGTSGISANAYYELARHDLARHDYRRGEAELDSMYARLNASKPAKTIEGAYELALSHYTAKGKKEKAALYAAAIDEQEKREEKGKAIKNTVRSLLSLEKEHLNNLDAAESGRDRMLWTAVGMAFLLMTIGGLWLNVHSRRSARRKSDEMKRKLDSVEHSLNSTMRAKEEMENRINAIKTSADTNAELLAALRNEGETTFKERFLLVHPAFLKALRSRVPGITNKEEVFCMLIALGQGNTQIRELLGIERQSVNMLRYRLRKKMVLAEGENEETIVKAIITSSLGRSAQEGN